MEEESTFYPHYEIHVIIQEPSYIIKRKAPSFLIGNNSIKHRRSRNIQVQSRIVRVGAIPKAEIIEWCDENLGKQYYHLGVDKIVVYSEINVMAVKLRWL